jgi:hypothetical protein
MNGIALPPGAERIGITARRFVPTKGNGHDHAAPKIGRASDLRTRKFPPVRYIVPGFIAEGCTLLAGRPKLGKSWLMLDVGLAVAAGRYCLGDARCEQGEVLYLALEDNERRLQRRIDKVLGAFSEEWPAAFEYATEWPRANEGGVEAIRDWIIRAKSPRLVVVDVLAMFKPARGDRETLYEADYASLKELQALAGAFGIGIVAVHHTRKSGSDSGDPVEKISGTLGLSGAADAFLILDRDGQGTSLAGRGRDIEEIETAVSFDRDACRWRVLGDAAEVRRSDERSVIVVTLQEACEPMSPAEVADAIGAPRNNVKQLLYKMFKAGEILKLPGRRGLYVHPSRTDLYTPDNHDNPITNGYGGHRA